MVNRVKHIILAAVVAVHSDFAYGILDEKKPRNDGKKYEELITFVADRAGHDFRYAIDATKLETELAWRADETFDTGIVKTVEWYLNKI